MVQGGAGIYTLEVLIDDVVSATYKTEVNDDAVIPLNVFQSVKVEKGTIFKLRIKSTSSGVVKILKYSSWSIGFIGKEIKGLEEFSVFLPEQQDEIGLDRYYNMKIDMSKANNQLSAGAKGKFISPSNPLLTFYNNIKFQTNLPNFFYVAVDLHV